MNERTEENVLKELLQLLELEKIEENIFRGQSQDLGFGAVFGGQVLGQALSAAYRTVPKARYAHSFHAYFLLHGDVARPIIYEVDCIRDGKSFTTRCVRAIQKGQAIFSMSASFHVSEPGFEHQDNAPEVTGPDGIESEAAIMQKIAERIPEGLRDRLVSKKPIEIRPIDPIDPFNPKKKDPIRYNWFKAAGPLPDNPAMHQYLLAYASDFYLSGTALYPHGHTYWESDIQAASLDHAMWFHRDFRMDDWLLHVMQSPNASGARGMNMGKIYTREGKLVATVGQESMIRYLPFKRQIDHRQ